MIIEKGVLKKLLIILISIIVVLSIIMLCIQYNKRKQENIFMEGEKQRVSQYTALTDFKTIQEVALYLNCNLIKQENSEKENVQYDIYMELPIKPYENEKSNKNFYEKLIQYSAHVLEYSNFIIIDETNKIDITVYCNQETNQVSQYYINGVENYFDVKISEQNINNFTQINSIDVDIKSTELKNIIHNNWKTDGLNLGTVESIYRNYDVYFDEGFEIRKVGGKVFNIVFNNRYKQEIINGLSTLSSNDEIIKQLGTPHFENGSLIGYKSKNLYMFFHNEHVSIYRVEEYDTSKIGEFIKTNEHNNDIQKLLDDIKGIWRDYDIYETSESGCILQYTLKGLCIKSDSTKKNGVVFYNNYKGNVYGNITLEQLSKGEVDVPPSNIYIENKDLVFEAELTRVTTLDDTTSNNNYSSDAILNTSNEFKTCTNIVNNTKENTPYYKVRFISINNKEPCSELRETINKGIWYDNYNFIYSVKGRGIFIYNAQTRKYSTIVTGNEIYNIKGLNNNTLFYDKTSVIINL